MANIPQQDFSESPKSGVKEDSGRSPDVEKAGKSSKESRRRSTVRLDRQTLDILRQPTGAVASNLGGRELNLFDVLGILKRQIWVVILLSLIGVAASGYYFTTQPKRYAAESSIYIPTQNSVSVLNSVGNRGGMMTQNMRGEKLETHAMIITSYEILANVWKDLSTDPEKKEHITTVSSSRNVEIDGDVAPDSATSEDARAINKLKGMLEVKVGGGREFADANSITISCEALDPIEAANIVNAVVEQFQEYFKEKYNRNNKEAERAIIESKEALAKETEVRKKELFDFIKESPNAFIGSEENNPLLTSLIKMSENMVDTDIQILRLENHLQSIEKAVEGRDLDSITEAELIAIFGGGDNEAILTSITGMARGTQDYEQFVRNAQMQMGESTIQHQIQGLELELVEARGKYSTDHPKVKALTSQIEELRAKAKALEEGADKSGMIGVISYPEMFKTYVLALKRRVEALKQEKAKITEYIEGKDDEIRKITEYRETIQAKRITIESLKSMQNNLEQNLKQLAMLSDVSTYQVEVLTAASPNDSPVYPNFIKFVFIGFVLGFASGVALAYLIDVTDATFHTPGEIARAVRMPILTQFPSFKHKLRDITPKKRKELREGHKPAPELLAYYHPNDPICEVWGQIRTRLFNRFKGMKGVVVMNTSPHPGDGKSMMIANIAVKIAEAGKRVLLIDCDLRKPDLHKWFGLSNEVGVSNVLAGKASIQDATSETIIKRLSFMSAGTERKAPAELIAGQKFDDFIEKVRLAYDYIFIDTPPVLYVNDAPMIASRTDGCMYVFRVRRRGRPDVVSGAKALAEVGSNMLGCIVNCYEKHRFYNETAVNDEPSDYGYGEYGGYGTGGYGYGDYSGYGYGGYSYGGYGYGGYGYGV